MASPSSERIRSQIRCLKNCETHFQEHGRLLEARTRLEEEIARLQKGDPEGLLPACRKKLADVDHRLDDLEESVETPPDELRLNILAALEELYPDELEEIAESKFEYIQRLDLQK
ncbi:MAG: hypothetical protein KDK48_06530, partial [Chlamydiia bacterium]|nr:hypothetical protein [Chlamydiia bacterium]